MKWSRADENWSGIKHDLDRERNRNNVVNEQTVLDYRVTLGITDRWSAGMSVPWIRGSWSVPLPLLPAGPRREQDAEGFGDLVVGPRLWLLDPRANPRGNVQVGLGLKVPTGDAGVRDRFPDLTGANVRDRPVDVSIQPGDGGWGAAFDLDAFRDVGRARLFLGGTYLFNPRETNRTFSTASALLGPSNVAPRIRFNSVPDQYLAQAGVAFPLGSGLGASVALRWEGVPPRDRFGGNDGFRRPGYTVSVAPGLSWTLGTATFSLTVPITTQRNRQEDAAGMAGDATFARWSILAGVTFRF
jgi:hypothetical protein